MSKHEIETAFPRLEDETYRITSPSTPSYNCIAWAAGDTEVWWWPSRFSYWPEVAPQEATVEAFVLAFEDLGYTICKSPSYEEEVQKIALYADEDGKPTHAARQLPSGKWTSKLGRLEDIEHADPEQVAGSAYGSVAAVMCRPRREG